MAPVQLGLDLAQAPDFSREAFVVSPQNALAVARLDAWSTWPGGALALVGPPGSGKTHLAMSWARTAGARVLAADFTAGDISDLDEPALLDDADRAPHGEELFHLINLAARPGRALLMTARTPPRQWSAEVPDLRSRLNALAVAELQAPDDEVLGGLLAKFFQERNIRPSNELLSYLMIRIERSVVRARDVVARLDEAAGAEGRPVSRALARKVLENDLAEDAPGDDNREDDLA